MVIAFYPFVDRGVGDVVDLPGDCRPVSGIEIVEVVAGQLIGLVAYLQRWETIYHWAHLQRWETIYHDRFSAPVLGIVHVSPAPFRMQG